MNNNFLKILWSAVFAVFLICVGFLAYSYFNTGSTAEKTTNKTKQGEKKSSNAENSSSEKTIEASEKEQKSDNFIDIRNNETSSSQGQKANGNSENNGTNSQSDKPMSSNYIYPKSYIYNERPLAEKTPIGSTGKVFESQKEAMEFGQSEVERLSKKDQKHYQFIISRVEYKDKTLAGWTVDISEQ